MARLSKLDNIKNYAQQPSGLSNCTHTSNRGNNNGRVRDPKKCTRGALETLNISTFKIPRTILLEMGRNGGGTTNTICKGLLLDMYTNYSPTKHDEQYEEKERNK